MRNSARINSAVLIELNSRISKIMKIVKEMGKLDHDLQGLNLNFTKLCMYAHKTL